MTNTQIDQTADTDLTWVYQTGATYLKDTEESHRSRYPQQGNQAEFLDLGASRGSRYIVADYDIWKSSFFSSALGGAILNVG